MKYVFGRNVTKSKNNERIDGEIFITQRTGSAQDEALDDAELSVLDAEHSIAYGCLTTIVEILCALAVFEGAVAIIDRLGESSIAQMYAEVPWAFFALCIGGALWLALWIFKKRKEKQPDKGGKGELARRNLRKLMEQSYKALGVPADAATVDVMKSEYKIKDGAVKLAGTSAYELAEYRVFPNGGDLCFADVHERLDLPMGDACLVRINKVGSVYEWHKDSKPQKEHYKLDRFGKRSGDGTLKFRFYGELRFNYMGIDYAVQLPPHEISAIEQLTGLTASE